jgi:hypothetical protein
MFLWGQYAIIASNDDIAACWLSPYFCQPFSHARPRLPHSKKPPVYSDSFFTILQMVIFSSHCMAGPIVALDPADLGGQFYALPGFLACCGFFMGRILLGRFLEHFSFSAMNLLIHLNGSSFLYRIDPFWIN